MKRTSLPLVLDWSSIITLWIAAALLGMLTSLLVWVFMKGFGWLNGVALDTFGALPAPAGQITTVLGSLIGIGFGAPVGADTPSTA